MWYKEIIYRLGIFSWQDALELLAIIAGVYSFAAWLAKDHQKKLVGKFFALTTVVIGAQFLELSTLGSLTINLYPAMLMLFILVHQTSLQKNFISLKNLQSPEPIVTTNWLQALLRSCLIAMNQKQTVYCIIEGQDAIGEFVTTPFMIKSKIQPDFLDLLMCSTNYNCQQMIWTTQSGTVMGINTSWKHIDQITSQETNTLELWRQNCLLFTAKTDLITFHIDPIKRTFEIIASGKSNNALPIDQGIKLLQQKLQKGLTTNFAKRKNLKDDQPVQTPS